MKVWFSLKAGGFQRHIGVFLTVLAFFTHAQGTEPRDRLTLPLLRHDGVWRSRGLLRNATLPLHGAVRDFGYFYAVVSLGTPPMPFALIVDTGSTITYVPCAACGPACGPNHQGGYFDPEASVTCRPIRCNDRLCSCGAVPCGCSDIDQCKYSRTYAEESSSSGLLLSDVVHLSDGKAPVRARFGCELRETGQIFDQVADGIMGLGDSTLSLVNQMAAAGAIDTSFALCFGGVGGGGVFFLGAPAAPPHVTLSYTPLVTEPQHPHYYIVHLDSLAVNNSAITVPKGTWEEGYGTVLDSGTTFTYLPSPAYARFVAAVHAHVTPRGLRRTNGPDPSFPDICYSGVGSRKKLPKYFPTLEFRFGKDGAVVLQGDPLTYLFMHAATKGAYCLGIFNNGQQGTLLGGITFRDVLVHYDRPAGRVGFGMTDCRRLGRETKPSPVSCDPSDSQSPHHQDGCLPSDGSGPSAAITDRPGVKPVSSGKESHSRAGTLEAGSDNRDSSSRQSSDSSDSSGHKWLWILLASLAGVSCLLAGIGSYLLFTPHSRAERVPLVSHEEASRLLTGQQLSLAVPPALSPAAVDNYWQQQQQQQQQARGQPMSLAGPPALSVGDRGSSWQQQQQNREQQGQLSDVAVPTTAAAEAVSSGQQQQQQQQARGQLSDEVASSSATVAVRDDIGNGNGNHVISGNRLGSHSSISGMPSDVQCDDRGQQQRQ